ncbi:hypothetical protein DFH07DRAFT_516435 [Mycena maculata]|uniref:Uncharacterized protein n=1 Tax=Mycena maculata TaxID=230809 RepID=A0AAD7J0G0_9AGAR|nr:hypothetical protein DFH07DRAFT_516435 [Mycena maculata]
MFNTTALSILKIPVRISGVLPLATVVTSLNSIASVAQVSELPYIQPMILRATAIVTTIQHLKENKRAFTRLAHDTHKMIETVMSAVDYRRGLSEELKRNVTDFTVVLEKIWVFIREHQSRISLLRLFAVADDAKKIQELRREIRMARELFEIRIHENIVHLVAENARRNADHPPP